MSSYIHFFAFLSQLCFHQYPAACCGDFLFLSVTEVSYARLSRAEDRARRNRLLRSCLTTFARDSAGRQRHILLTVLNQRHILLKQPGLFGQLCLSEP
jgi:hypothetical protein